MGTYINLGNEGFKTSRQDEYVDKSGLISEINKTLNTRKKYSCVTRCRRFGKSMAAEMLCAYYDRSCDSRELFADLQIANDPTFEEHLNKYPVIYLDMTYFTTQTGDKNRMVEIMTEKVEKDLLDTYPEVRPRLNDNDELIDVLLAIASTTGQKFIMIIDEWDAICREFLGDEIAMRKYVDWLRQLFKGNKSERVFAGVYMTGILPIKKDNTQSALNNFREYSMVTPGRLASFFGFTKDEVRVLCDKHGMDFDEMVKWYDGYRIGNEPSMLNPNSVMQAIWNEDCTSYWSKTGAFDTIADYINMNYEGLKDDIIYMLAGGRCDVDTTGFENDLAEIKSKDDVLTVLIHLGYLSYDKTEGECYIPNREVAGEMVNAVKRNKWKVVSDAIDNSKKLLQATLNLDSDLVAQALDKVHEDNTSILAYNDENSLSCVVNLAYYYAKNDYIFFRELPSGKGFADIVMLPRKNVNKPALVVELKYDKDADTAIRQIHERRYTGQLAEYTDDILLVAINYDKQTKTHDCQIERWVNHPNLL